MRRLFVAGNWKMNGNRNSAVELAGGLAAALPAGGSSADIAVCPPFPHLDCVGAALAGSAVTLGAQNAYFEKSGAFTGEVSLEMLVDLGCQWVILGHSERRHVLGETSELISKKIAAAVKQGLKPILCVGEQKAERLANETEAVLNTQMTDSLQTVDAAAMAQVVIAYEPVWAIGTGLTATTEQAESAHVYLRTWLANRYNSQLADATRILYGGSVKADNALQLMSQPDVDGALVGGASLKLNDFLPIIRAAEGLRK